MILSTPMASMLFTLRAAPLPLLLTTWLMSPRQLLVLIPGLTMSTKWKWFCLMAQLVSTLWTLCTTKRVSRLRSLLMLLFLQKILIAWMALTCRIRSVTIVTPRSRLLWRSCSIAAMVLLKRTSLPTASAMARSLWIWSRPRVLWMATMPLIWLLMVRSPLQRRLTLQLSMANSIVLTMRLTSSWRTAMAIIPSLRLPSWRLMLLLLLLTRCLLLRRSMASILCWLAFWKLPLFPLPRLWTTTS